MSSLRELANKYDAQKKHLLPIIYEEYIAGWRDNPVSMLELGVESGASLQMWRDYFPKGQVAGLDHKHRRVDEPRVRVYVGSQDDPDVLRRIAEECGPFDMIVDDASHRPDPTWVSIVNLWPHLKPSGLYFLEDYHASWRDKYAQENGRTMASVLIRATRSIVAKRPALPDLVALDVRWRLAVLRKAPHPTAHANG